MWRVSPLLSSSTWPTVAMIKPYLSACFTSGQRFKFHSLLLSKKWEAAGVLPLNVWLGVAVTITNHGLDPLLLAHADSGTIDERVQHYNGCFSQSAGPSPQLSCCILLQHLALRTSYQGIVQTLQIQYDSVLWDLKSVLSRQGFGIVWY